jgi:hypothetical protein
MSRRPRGLAFAALLACAAVTQTQEPPLPDAQAFLADALTLIRSNDLVRSRYTFTETETRYSYGVSGSLTKKQVRVYEVDPSPDAELTYRRLVSVNGVPPSDLAKRDAEHQRKVQEWTARRQQEGENARAARARRAAEEEARERAVVGELTSIYDIQMMGRDPIDGRPAILFAFDPRPGYGPRTSEGRIIHHFRGRAWFDEQDRELVRLQVEALETVSVKFGFIFRLLKGSRGLMERRKIDGQAWLPTYTRFTGSGRVLFVARIDLDQESAFSSYRKKEPGS